MKKTVNATVVAAAAVGVAAVSSSTGATTAMDTTVSATGENASSEEAVVTTITSTIEGNVSAEESSASAATTDASTKADSQAMEVDGNAVGSGPVDVKSEEAVAEEVPVVSVSEPVVEGTNGEQNETTAEAGSGQDQGPEQEQEALPAAPAAVAVSEAEAMEWRAHFHAACRWFDTDQDKFLRADHLLLILQSSPREVSRADLSSAVWRVCKEQERLRYDSFI